MVFLVSHRQISGLRCRWCLFRTPRDRMWSTPRFHPRSPFISYVCEQHASSGTMQAPPLCGWFRVACTGKGHQGDGGRSIKRAGKCLWEWLTDNNLSIHLGKTESILFGTRKRRARVEHLKISCGQAQIAGKDSVRYLGVDLDKHLSGEQIASKIIAKCAGKIKFLYRNTQAFNIKIKKLLVTSPLQCHFDYASSAWFSGLTAKVRGKLQVMQNKAVRYLLNLPPRTHLSREEFKNAGMLPVHLRVQQLKLNQMYNIIHKTAPSYLSTQIVMVHTKHQHNTRASVNSCSVPRVNSVAQSSFFYTGIALWNELPPSVRLTNSKVVYKSKVRNHLFEKVQD